MFDKLFFLRNKQVDKKNSQKCWQFTLNSTQTWKRVSISTYLLQPFSSEILVNKIRQNSKFKYSFMPAVILNLKNSYNKNCTLYILIWLNIFVRLFPINLGSNFPVSTGSVMMIIESVLLGRINSPINLASYFRNKSTTNWISFSITFSLWSDKNTRDDLFFQKHSFPS